MLSDSVLRELLFKVLRLSCWFPSHVHHVFGEMCVTSFSESSDTSNTLLSLGFGILFLLRLILLCFPMLISQSVGLTKRAHLVLVIFSDFLLFVS
jgi:hypothetical protein